MHVFDESDEFYQKFAESDKMAEDAIKQGAERNNILKEMLAELKKISENTELMKEALLYMPGSVGEQTSKDHFVETSEAHCISDENKQEENQR